MTRVKQLKAIAKQPAAIADLTETTELSVIAVPVGIEKEYWALL